ncbi:hypothetical protein GUITHDRAFT_162291 [Guillardia theta CCMP2712]|uniref:Uncharacterized protein n=1 Tax=Guillardia theta (strain CCMP2712) TaxID=905079 RepID=L1JK80_GUITC|nr:hypothetical protein GUITHDRAFT_162291 [Guillardia theta CCMP2712]EKX48727.1 hypothetical protein GUITHDRAFT_162291 [Guillardia theta CCMP2712]|eukprot:XP_005835707.1 hypothetical protein GUITHDRAFT_162291 [Guillardia theta CCMP2712]
MEVGQGRRSTRVGLTVGASGALVLLVLIMSNYQGRDDRNLKVNKDIDELLAINSYPNYGNYLSKDSTALSYDSSASSQDKFKTLHALAQAAKEEHRLHVQSSMSPDQKISSISNPISLLKNLAKAHDSSTNTKKLKQASDTIKQVMEQSLKDEDLRRKVLSEADSVNKKDGSSWNSLLANQIGPHSLAMASDWLSTELATSKSKKKGATFARAQLAAALSQLRRACEKLTAALQGEVSSSRSSSLVAFESAVAKHVMSNALSSHQESDPYGGASDDSYSSSQQSKNSGVAPGLSSYDAQILANGPPS